MCRPSPSRRRSSVFFGLAGFSRFQNRFGPKKRRFGRACRGPPLVSRGLRLLIWDGCVSDAKDGSSRVEPEVLGGRYWQDCCGRCWVDLRGEGCSNIYVKSVTDGGWRVAGGDWRVIDGGWWGTILTYGLHQTKKKFAGQTTAVKMSKTGDVRTYGLHETKIRNSWWNRNGHNVQIFFSLTNVLIYVYTSMYFAV